MTVNGIMSPSTLSKTESSNSKSRSLGRGETCGSTSCVRRVYKLPGRAYIRSNTLVSFLDILRPFRYRSEFQNRKITTRGALPRGPQVPNPDFSTHDECSKAHRGCGQGDSNDSHLWLHVRGSVILAGSQCHRIGAEQVWIIRYQSVKQMLWYSRKHLRKKQLYIASLVT